MSRVAVPKNLFALLIAGAVLAPGVPSAIAAEMWGCNFGGFTHILYKSHQEACTAGCAAAIGTGVCVSPAPYQPVPQILGALPNRFEHLGCSEVYPNGNEARQGTTCRCNTALGLRMDPAGNCKCLTGVWTGTNCAASCPVGQKAENGKCAIAPAKGNVCTVGVARRGNPCNAATGVKTDTQSVYASSTLFGLSLNLSYNSVLPHDEFNNRVGPFGRNWVGSLDPALEISGKDEDGSIAGVILVRPGGQWISFARPPSGTSYLADADISYRVQRIDAPDGALLGWGVQSAIDDEVENYDAQGRILSVVSRAGLTRRYTYSSGTTNNTQVARYPGDAPACSMAHPPVAGGAIVQNRLLCITDPFGRQVNFQYDPLGRTVKFFDPAGAAHQFEYDDAQNLTRITFPDSRSRQLFYNEASHINGGASCPNLTGGLPNHLTGIVDEEVQRHADYHYDCQGRVTSTQRAGGTRKLGFAYGAPGSGQTTVTDFVGDPASPTTTSRVYSFSTVLNIAKLTGIVDPATGQPAPCASCGSERSVTYDANGNIAARSDWNGNRTEFTFDPARNLETSRTEGLSATGATTPQTRTISTQWHSTFRLPAAIAEPLRMTTYTYDPDGNSCGARGALCSKSIQPTTDANGSQGFGATPSGAPRAWAYTYNANGTVLTVDGPRTDVADVTTYTYYANHDAEPGNRSNVATIRNAAGHLTQVTAYNAHGQPLTLVDANGLVTTLTYDARQRLISRLVGTELTSYDYDGIGQLTKVTLPDGSFLSYTYDDAHRLTAIQDSQGNRIAYTLDAMGNRTREEVRDPANQLAQMRSRVFNNLNHLFQELGAANQATEFGHDSQGNVVTIKDPLNRVTTNQYDALNRLRQVTSPLPISAITQYAYDGLDQLVSVSDPRSLVTNYTVSGLGNLARLASPDTGITTSTHDEAGNLLTQTDAKGQTTAYAYDALNRVTLITFHDGSKQAYAYDQGSNAIGRLTSITETDSASQVTSLIAYAYDQHGRVISETRTVAGVQYVVAYAYDSFGRLSGITYPSGRTVTFGFDGLGRVGQVTTTRQGASQTVLENAAYQPFGTVKSYTLGNGQAYTRAIDLDGRIASYTLGAETFPIVYDEASRISILGANSYGYDNLDRLTAAVSPTTPYSYNYDAVGNRLARTAGSSTDTYKYSNTSNRIDSITPTSGPLRNFAFDPNGSTISDGLNTYAYDARGRMVQAVSSLGTTTYQVNALGQRIRKTNSAEDTVFHYDTRGRLIAETDASGAVKREYIYLGDIPVAVFQ